jgi:hypothetical protein
LARTDAGFAVSLMTPTSHRVAVPCLGKSVFESNKVVMKSLHPVAQIVVKLRREIENAKNSCNPLHKIDVEVCYKCGFESAGERQQRAEAKGCEDFITTGKPEFW